MTDYSRSGAAFGRTELAWQDAAACQGKEKLFFGPDDEANAPRDRRVAKARAICSGCAVRTACLDFRLEFESQLDGGIWAGADELERTRLRYNRRRNAARKVAW